MIDLILKDIQDPYIRENFFRLSKLINEETLFNGNFEFFEKEFSQTDTFVEIPHGLDFIPEDIVMLSVEGDINIYFDHASFTKISLRMYVRGPCKVRFLAGLFKDKNYGRMVSDLLFVGPKSKAADVTIDDSALLNTIVGDDLQEYLNRFHEPSESELPAYNGDGTISNVEHFSSSTQVVANRIFRVDMTYDADLQPLTEVWKIYSKTNGTTILKTITLTYTWVANVLTNKTQVTA